MLKQGLNVRQTEELVRRWAPGSASVVAAQEGDFEEELNALYERIVGEA